MHEQRWIDFFPWGYVKARAYVNKPRTLVALEENIHDKITKILPAMLKNVFTNFVKMIKNCLAHHEEHLSDILFKTWWIKTYTCLLYVYFFMLFLLSFSVLRWIPMCQVSLLHAVLRDFKIIFFTKYTAQRNCSFACKANPPLRTFCGGRCSSPIEYWHFLFLFQRSAYKCELMHSDFTGNSIGDGSSLVAHPYYLLGRSRQWLAVHLHRRSYRVLGRSLRRRLLVTSGSYRNNHYGV